MAGHQMRLYNSLGSRIEDFTPSSNPSGMYSCGPTVYAFPHLGNMRPYVFADTVRRALRWKGINVHHVINITDVGHAVADTDTGEDKVEAAAARERRSVQDIAEFYTDAFFNDINALNILPADEYPRASAYVPQMIEFAAELQKKAPRLADLVEAGYHPTAFRLFLLGAHYRSQLDFTTAAIDATQATLRRLLARIQPLRPLPAADTWRTHSACKPTRPRPAPWTRSTPPSRPT